MGSLVRRKCARCLAASQPLLVHIIRVFGAPDDRAQDAFALVIHAACIMNAVREI